MLSFARNGKPIDPTSSKCPAQGKQQYSFVKKFLSGSLDRANDFSLLLRLLLSTDKNFSTHWNRSKSFKVMFWVISWLFFPFHQTLPLAGENRIRHV